MVKYASLNGAGATGMALVGNASVDFPRNRAVPATLDPAHSPLFTSARTSELVMGVGEIVSGLIARRRGVVRARAGTAAVEFALVAPMLLLLVLGMCQFGLTLNQYLTLTNAVRSG